MTEQQRQSTKAIRLLMPYAEDCFGSSKRLRSEHPDWGDIDTRLTVFRKYGGVALNTVVHLKCREQYIGLPPKPVRLPRTSLESQVSDLKNLDMFVKLSFFLGSFIAVESSLRCVFRALRPGERGNGTGAFYGVYGDVLDDLGLEKYVDLFDVLRNLRNAIHNNMAHFDKNGNDKTIAWSGHSYSFFHGKVVDWVTWEALIQLLGDTRIALADIVDADKVAALKSIEDTAIAGG